MAKVKALRGRKKPRPGARQPVLDIIGHKDIKALLEAKPYRRVVAYKFVTSELRSPTIDPATSITYTPGKVVRPHKPMNTDLKRPCASGIHVIPKTVARRAWARPYSTNRIVALMFLAKDALVPTESRERERVPGWSLFSYKFRVSKATVLREVHFKRPKPGEWAR